MMEGKQLAPRDLFRKVYEQTEKKPDVNIKTVFDEILKSSEVEVRGPGTLPCTCGVHRSCPRVDPSPL